MRNLVRILLTLNFLLSSSCVSRMERPIILGVVTDFDGKPIKNCAVGESTTDEYGNFTLSEIKYNQFLLTEMFQMEAPPLRISEIISKEGYESKEVYAFSSHGGGSKDYKWNLDTIRLKDRKREIFDLNNSNWKISTNKEMDSLYFIRSNFHTVCKTRKCRDFYYNYNQYADNYLSPSGKNNLSKGVIRKLITVNFKTDKNFSIKKIIQYGNKNGSHSKLKENDTIITNGVWNFNDEKYTFKCSLNELNGVYEIVAFDYEFILMVKTTSNNGNKQYQ